MTLGPPIRPSARSLDDEQRAYAYALGAMYHVAQGFDADAPTGEPEAGRNAYILSDSWDATDRDTLIQRMTDLGTDGHRTHHVRIVRYYSMLWRPAVAAKREEMRAAIREGGDGAEAAKAELWRLDAVQANIGGVRSSSLLAFDAARGIMLARAGLMLGWLEEAEAWAYMLDVARDVQRSYASWKDYAADFLLARNMWAGDRTEDLFNAIVADLLSEGASPWVRLAWEQPGLVMPGPLRPAEDGPEWTLERG